MRGVLHRLFVCVTDIPEGSVNGPRARSRWRAQTRGSGKLAPGYLEPQRREWRNGQRRVPNLRQAPRRGRGTGTREERRGAGLECKALQYTSQRKTEGRLLEGTGAGLPPAVTPAMPDGCAAAPHLCPSNAPENGPSSPASTWPSSVQRGPSKTTGAANGTGAVRSGADPGVPNAPRGHRTTVVVNLRNHSGTHSLSALS
mmetsp:Transcript_58379/g.96801  ORF Transcript_58379/g.96801 Transcript_58379/m.96801 type:complete len:200 (-) Transcript_58379:61-660(-)